MKTARPRSAAHRMFRAFSDPTRVRILSLLSRGERCVGDLVQVLDVPQPTASRHLAYLRRSGIVQTRESGLWVYYRLAPAQTAFHRKLLECLAACFTEIPEVKGDARRLARLGESGRGCCPS